MKLNSLILACILGLALSQVPFLHQLKSNDVYTQQSPLHPYTTAYSTSATPSAHGSAMTPNAMVNYYTNAIHPDLA